MRNEFQPVLSDFGLAKFKDIDSPYYELMDGTKRYRGEKT